MIDKDNVVPVLRWIAFKNAVLLAFIAYMVTVTGSPWWAAFIALWTFITHDDKKEGS